MSLKPSLRFKLMSVIAAMGLAAMALVGFLAFKGITAMLESKEDLVKAAADGLIDKIDRNLFERYGDVQAFALSEPARSADASRITAFMSDMMAAYAPIYDMMIVVDAHGSVIVANQVDKNGKPLDSRSLIGKNYAKETWFKAAISGDVKPGSSFVEDLHVDQDVDQVLKNGGRVMNFTAPIRNASTGAIIGVWTNRVSWADVVEAITKEETEKVKSGNVVAALPYLVDADGTYLLHPQGAAYELTKKFPGFHPTKEGEHPATILSTHEIDLPQLKGDVIEAVSASKGYSTYPGKSWRAVLQVPASDAQIQLNERIVIAAFLILLFGMGIAYLVVRSVVKVLTGINAELNSQAAQVRAAATEISGTSTQLAEASNDQASALQETAASIQEISAMVKKNSDNAARSRDVAAVSHGVANKGKAAVGRMIQAVDDVNVSNGDIIRQVNESNRQIGEIVKVINEIGEKTKVINEIVFQTKLLSFNASVEAARAGEHGKGFAVVAEEVGNLARMSGSAAKEISEMLAGSVQKVEAIVNDTRLRIETLVAHGRTKVEACSAVAGICGQTLDEVVKNVAEVTLLVGEITSATQEQAQGIAEITKAMNLLDGATQGNSQMSQSAAESADRLASQAESLYEAVATLTSLVVGGNDGSGRVATPELAAAPLRPALHEATMQPDTVDSAA